MENLNNNRLTNLQLLRFLAAFIVIFAHVELYEMRSKNIQGDLFGLGAIGVDIFFVISGFIMVHVSRRIRTKNIVEAVIFFCKRLFRVLPLYSIFVLITALMAWIFAQYPFPHNESVDLYYGPGKYDLAAIKNTLTFTHWGVPPTFTIGWTLIYEFWFYVLFAICIASRINVYVFFLIFSMCVVSLDYFNVEKSPFIATITNPLMLEFVFGVYLYAIYNATLRWNDKGWFMAGLLVTAAFFILAYYDPYFLENLPRSYHRSLLWGSAGFFIVFLFLSMEKRYQPSSFLVFLGNASYSIYLGHWFCLTITPFLFWKLGWFPNGSLSIYIFVVVGLGLAFGVITHLYVERNLTRWFSPLLAKIDRLRNYSLLWGRSRHTVVK